MPSQTEIRQQITSTIIDALTNGDLPPWRKPWRTSNNAGAHANVVSKKPYSGVNPLLLEIASHRHGFQSRWWATFKQWKEMGGSVMRRPANVRPGSWGTTVVFCRQVTKTKTDDSCEETKDSFWMLRTYTLFNIDQVVGDDLDHLRVGNDELDNSDVQERFDRAEEVIAACEFDIRYGGERAFYNFENDFIQVPHRSRFTLPEFYETVFHEMVHATENSKRLSWDRATEGYAMGELVAALGGCFLASEIGLPTADNLTNHAAYIKGWIKAMENDPKFIFRASALASKAADFILSFSRTPEATPEPVEAPALV